MRSISVGSPGDGTPRNGRSQDGPAPRVPSRRSSEASGRPPPLFGGRYRCRDPKRAGYGTAQRRGTARDECLRTRSQGMSRLQPSHPAEPPGDRDVLGDDARGIRGGRPVRDDGSVPRDTGPALHGRPCLGERLPRAETARVPGQDRARPARHPNRASVTFPHDQPVGEAHPERMRQPESNERHDMRDEPESRRSDVHGEWGVA